MLSSQRALFDLPRDVCYLNAASYSPLALKSSNASRQKAPNRDFANLFPRIFSVNAFGSARGSKRGHVTS